ncbi:MAG: hypothetical protein EXS35_08025 [Pedosphaera sp.]|nr:hypothetical protein [Pedosphaera sp.]
MKHLPFSASRLTGLAMGMFLLTALGARAQAGELKLEAQLIWGTNTEKSTDPAHKAVDPKLEKKLKKLPFKWQHYFEVNRREFTARDGEAKKISISKDCEIKVRRVDGETVEVQLFGKGQLVSKISQKLPKGECLVTGGNAADSTGWFVVLRQMD